MKMKNILLMLLLAGTLIAFNSCRKYPVDDNLQLITTKVDCYMSYFQLLGSDGRPVLNGTALIDTIAQTVTAEAVFGTNIKHVKPYCSVATDAKVEPNMGVWTDFSEPRQYKVISGNRKVEKTYTITITVQGQ